MSWADGFILAVMAGLMLWQECRCRRCRRKCHRHTDVLHRLEDVTHEAVRH